MRKPKFEIFQKVYHITPESPQGVVINIRYLYIENTHEYLVAFEHDKSLWYSEYELSTSKTF